MTTETPQLNSKWRHTNGRVYLVYVIANEHSTRPEYPPTVVYYSERQGTWYARPVSDWARSMTRIDT